MEFIAKENVETDQHSSDSLTYSSCQQPTIQPNTGLGNSMPNFLQVPTVIVTVIFGVYPNMMLQQGEKCSGAFSRLPIRKDSTLNRNKWCRHPEVACNQSVRKGDIDKYGRVIRVCWYSLLGLQILQHSHVCACKSNKSRQHLFY